MHFPSLPFGWIWKWELIAWQCSKRSSCKSSCRWILLPHPGRRRTVHCQHRSVFALVTIGVAAVGSVTFIFHGITLKRQYFAIPAWLTRLTCKNHSQCMFCAGIPLPSVQDLQCSAKENPWTQKWQGRTRQYKFWTCNGAGLFETCATLCGCFIRQCEHRWSLSSSGLAKPSVSVPKIYERLHNWFRF